MSKEEILEEFRALPSKDQGELLRSLNKIMLKERVQEIQEGIELPHSMQEITKEVRAVRNEG